VACSIYKGSSWLNLRTFFNVTSVILIVFGAGLLAHGIHELQEAGMFPFIIEHVWDINHIINEDSTLGTFLKVLIGYNGNPGMLEVIAYVTYISSTLTLYFWRKRKRIEKQVVPEAMAFEQGT